MREQLALRTLSLVIGALMMATLVLPNPANAAGKWDGEWVGKIVQLVDQNCPVNFDLIKLTITDRKISAFVGEPGQSRNLVGAMSEEGKIFAKGTLHHNGPKNTMFPINISGKYKNTDVLEGYGDVYFDAGYGIAPAEEICDFHFELYRKDSTKAEAILSGQDPEILRL